MYDQVQLIESFFFFFFIIIFPVKAIEISIFYSQDIQLIIIISIYLFKQNLFFVIRSELKLKSFTMLFNSLYFEFKNRFKKIFLL